MIFETTHKVENNVFSVSIAFEGYGTDDMDEAPKYVTIFGWYFKLSGVPRN